MKANGYEHRIYPTNTSNEGVSFVFKYGAGYSTVEIQDGLWIAFKDKCFSFGGSSDEAIDNYQTTEFGR